MQQKLTAEKTEKVDKLVAELRAICHWDSQYWQHLCPRRYERIAHVSRQKRRAEILHELVGLSRE